MQLALHTDYALRTLIYLAFRDDRRTAQDVARFYGISEAHVAKVINQLARLGYIRTIRGVGGGIELARRPEDIRVGEVIASFEGNLHLLECVGIEDVCVIQPFCKLRNVLAEAERIQTEYLNSVTLAQLLPTRRQVARVARNAEKQGQRLK